MPFLFNLIATCVREIAVALLHLELLIFSFVLLVVHALLRVGLNKVLFYKFLNLHLLFPILPQLILYETREILFLPDFSIAVKIVMAVFKLYLLHVEIEDFLVRHLIVPHVNTLAKLGHKGRGVNETKTGLCSSSTSTSNITITLLSHSYKLPLPRLWIGIRKVHVTMSLLS
jgi:hypothetical protein